MTNSLVFFAIADWGKGDYNVGSRRVRKIEEKGEENWHEKENAGEDNRPQEGAKEDESCEDGYEFCQLLTAKSMMAVASSNGKPSFILALGDNFYDDGVSGSDDPMFRSNFKGIYFNTSHSNGTDSILSGIPFHSAFGNHDLGYGTTGVEAQINRTTTTEDDEWQMHGKWYTVNYAIPQGGSVQVVVLDTTWLSPSETEATSQLPESTQSWRQKQHLLDLENTLRKLNEKPPTYTILAGHYPVFSHGEKGDNYELIEGLLPLMQQFKVSAYIAGHDHNAQHLTYGEQNFFVTGHSTMKNSDLMDESNNMSAAKRIWGLAGDAGFSRFEATPSRLNVQYYSSKNSSVVYECVIHPSQSSERPSVPHETEYIIGVAGFAFIVTLIIQLILMKSKPASGIKSNFITVIKTSPRFYNSEKHPGLEDEPIDF